MEPGKAHIKHSPGFCCSQGCPELADEMLLLQPRCIHKGPCSFVETPPPATDLLSIQKSFPPPIPRLFLLDFWMESSARRRSL